MSTEKKQIGIFGFGTVGFGFWQILKENPSQDFQIKTIVVKNRNKQRPEGAGPFSFQKEDILKDASIQVVIELIDDAEEAYHIVKEALLAKKDVVTANKKMLATHVSELEQLAQQNGVSLLYEAAVAGSIPIIRELDHYYGKLPLNRISGIINGSTNYILGRQIEGKLTFNQALKEAQDAGFAETDPTLDIGGWDAANKLVLLARHGFNLESDISQVVRKGIVNIGQILHALAIKFGAKIKLIAEAIPDHRGNIALSVLPAWISGNNELAHVHREYNGIILENSTYGLQFLLGKGAGSRPTGSAVYSDLISIDRPYRTQGRGWNKRFSIGEVIKPVLISGISAGDTETLPFKEKPKLIASAQGDIIYGELNLSQITSEQLEQLALVVWRAEEDPVEKLQLPQGAASSATSRWSFF